MKTLSLVSLIALAISAANAQTPSSTPPAAAPPPAARGPQLEVALEAARTAIDDCLAREQNVAVSVVDAAGVLKVLLAANGTSPRGVQSSTTKAVTALTFNAPTSELAEKVKTDTALAEKISANTSFNARAGGVLLKSGNEVIGAIGVGGARGSEKDEACALAAIAKVQSRL